MEESVEPGFSSYIIFVTVDRAWLLFSNSSTPE